MVTPRLPPRHLTAVGRQEALKALPGWAELCEAVPLEVRLCEGGGSPKWTELTHIQHECRFKCRFFGKLLLLFLLFCHVYIFGYMCCIGWYKHRHALRMCMPAYTLLVCSLHVVRLDTQTCFAPEVYIYIIYLFTYHMKVDLNIHTQSLS